MKNKSPVGMPFLIETKTVEEAVQLCSSLDMAFVELNMNFPQCQLSKLSSDPLNRMKKDYGIYFSIHVDENFNAFDFNPKVREAYLNTMLETIELAKEIGAPIINMHLAKGILVTLPGSKVFLFQQFEAHYRKCLQIFRKTCKTAIGSAPVKICVENTNGFMDHERSAIAYLLESDCFGLTLDIGHSHAAGGVDLDFYKMYETRLLHMHAHDAVGKNHHLALGDGEMDWRSCIQLASKRRTRIVLETKTIAALKKSVRVFNEN